MGTAGFLNIHSRWPKTAALAVVVRVYQMNTIVSGERVIPANLVFGAVSSLIRLMDGVQNQSGGARLQAQMRSQLRPRQESARFNGQVPFSQNSGHHEGDFVRK